MHLYTMAAHERTSAQAGAERFASIVRTCFVRFDARRPAQGWRAPKVR